MIKTCRAIVLMGLVAGFAVGCAANATDSSPTGVESRADGLSIAEADEAAGKLVAVFRKDGREITFDLRLGPKMEIEQLDPEHPSFQIDARGLDANGQPLFMQRGGDQFLDASWAMPKIENIDEAGRAADMKLTREAESAFAALKLPAALAQLRLGAMDIARSMETIAEKDGSQLVPGPMPTDPTGTVAPKGSIYWGPSSTAYWDYQIHRKDALFDGNPAEHTATRLRGWSSSYGLLFSANSCNHGTCAGSSPMTVKCTMPGYRSDDGTHSRYWYDDGCSTGYNLVSMWGHNCNDDTRRQIAAMYYDSWQDMSGGLCNDVGWQLWGPGSCTP